MAHGLDLGHGALSSSPDAAHKSWADPQHSRCIRWTHSACPGAARADATFSAHPFWATLDMHIQCLSWSGHSRHHVQHSPGQPVQDHAICCSHIAHSTVWRLWDLCWIQHGADSHRSGCHVQCSPGAAGPRHIAHSTHSGSSGSCAGFGMQGCSVQDLACRA